VRTQWYIIQINIKQLQFTMVSVRREYTCRYELTHSLQSKQRCGLLSIDVIVISCLAGRRPRLCERMLQRLHRCCATFSTRSDFLSEVFEMAASRLVEHDVMAKACDCVAYAAIICCGQRAGTCPARPRLSARCAKLAPATVYEIITV
jgi:hypothetical protein